MDIFALVTKHFGKGWIAVLQGRRRVISNSFN
jgi:hypothetical protein